LEVDFRVVKEDWDWKVFVMEEFIIVEVFGFPGIGIKIVVELESLWRVGIDAWIDIGEGWIGRVTDDNGVVDLSITKGGFDILVGYVFINGCSSTWVVLLLFDKDDNNEDDDDPDVNNGIGEGSRDANCFVGDDGKEEPSFFLLEEGTMILLVGFVEGSMSRYVNWTYTIDEWGIYII